MNLQPRITRSGLEQMVSDKTVEPKALPLSLLEDITNGFSDEQEIGRGGFAVVYKGMLDNGVVVAVKRLSKTHMFQKEFNRELECLMKVKHENVIRLLGYCVDLQGKPAETCDGQFVIAHEEQKLLCFEYLTHGTLHEHIKDPSHGLDWRKRYKIIIGICEGLHYLHQNQIFHLDLKPPNILLDGDMLPKITDFGLSRCINEQQGRITTTNIGGTMGYLAPESVGGREITYRFDLYSLGVIVLEILNGKKGYHSVDDVLESWSNRLEESQRDIELKQVRLCAEIGIECTKFNPAERPVSMQHIIDRLRIMESTDDSKGTSISRSLVLRAENSSNELHQDTPKDPGETSSQTSSVSALVDEMSSIAVSATSSDQPRRTIAPKDPGEKNTEDFVFPGSSTSVSGRMMSEHMPVAVLTAVTKIGFILGDEAAKPIIRKLSERVPNLKELPVKLNQIRKQLTLLSNVIRQIGTVYLDDEVVVTWIGEVRKMAYHVEDVMDKYSYHVLQFQKEGLVKKFFTKGTQSVKVFSKIVDDVAQVEKEIWQVIQLKDHWLQPSKLVADPGTEMERQQYQDSFPGFVKDEDLVGIEDSRILLTGWLYSEELESTVITVSGMGGLGKSTLVSNLYEREKVNFSARAWIGVSQIYTVDSLLRKLLWKIGYAEQPLSAGIDKMDVYDLKEETKRRLENRKCLIVLDDVWDQEAYFQLHDAFQNLQGSRIVITTRKDHVAGISSPTRHLELEPLSQPDAFELFCRRAFYNQKGHTCPKELETIATSIVDRCHGLPLAIVTIGSMLSSRQRLEIWTQKYNQLRTVLSNNDHVRAILNLSYRDLSGDLQLCFLYCILFHEDNPMSRDSLVRLWVAEGFVQSKEKNTPEMVAEGNLMELIHRNMLEVVENDELGRISTCKMHGTVRELAISIAKEERFASASDYGTMMLMDKDVRRLSLSEWKDHSHTAVKVQLPQLRTVVSTGEISSSIGMLSSILSKSSYLTVLDLQDSEVSELPALIGHLFNLRYIGLRRTNVKSLPDSIENLSNLHTLDIKETRIEKLPRGVVKIKKLRHLLADRYDDEKQTEFPCFIGVQAPEKISNLEELQTLETVKSSNDLAQQLKKLTQLRSVWIENISAADCANLFATLSNMPYLSRLLLSARDENEALCFEALKPKSVNLHSLIIRGQWAKGTLNCPIFSSHGTNLKYLDLNWCHLGEDPLGMLAPHLPNLTYLKLANMHSANTLVISADYFPNMKTLALKQMPDVRELNIIDGALPCIESLYIVSLSKLDKVPQGIESLPSLKKLWLLDLHKNFISKWVTQRMNHKVLHVPEVRI